MAVPFTQIATEAIYNHSKELADLISSNISIVGMLGAKGRIQIIEGGLGWRERVFYGSNANDGHRAKTAQIPTNLLENMTMASYDPALFSSSIVINGVERDMAKGDAALGDLVKDAWEVGKTSAVTAIGGALWAGTQVSSNYPIPLPAMVPTTATASQTGTDRGGISSTDNSWWRSYTYATTVADLGAAAGLLVLQRVMNAISRSSAKVSQPDFGLTTAYLFARLTSTTEAYRRFTSDSKIASLGYDNVTFGNMSVLWDALCPAKRFYLLNSRHLKMKCLKQPDIQNINVNANQYSLPMVIKPFKDDIDTLNLISVMNLAYALTCSDLASQGVMTDCTEG